MSLFVEAGEASEQVDGSSQFKRYHLFSTNHSSDYVKLTLKYCDDDKNKKR